MLLQAQLRMVLYIIAFLLMRWTVSVSSGLFLYLESKILAEWQFVWHMVCYLSLSSFVQFNSRRQHFPPSKEHLGNGFFNSHLLEVIVEEKVPAHCASFFHCLKNVRLTPGELTQHPACWAVPSHGNAVPVAINTEELRASLQIQQRQRGEQ